MEKIPPNRKMARPLRYLTASELLDWRMSLDLTQEGAAEALGVPYSTFRNWEKGWRKCPAIVAAMCERVAPLPPPEEPMSLAEAIQRGITRGLAEHK